MSNIFQKMLDSSFLSGNNASYIETMYENYLENNHSVSSEWVSYFEKMISKQPKDYIDFSHKKIREQFLALKNNQNINFTNSTNKHPEKQVYVQQLINAYRVRGHQNASLDPLNLVKREKIPELTIGNYGFNGADLDDYFHTGSLAGPDQATLKEIIKRLQKTYCGSIGAEFMHIVDLTERHWFQQRLESSSGDFKLSELEQKHILDRIDAAEGLEKYLASKYPGTKRFGLEGGESLIPLMDEMIERLGSYGVHEIVICMAHRGRLNVLVNILGKKPSDLFEEFEDRRKITNGSGDVKYHQGFSSDLRTKGGVVHLALAFNPSHLEIVTPVVEGSVRARQFRDMDTEREKIIPVSIHGDAAFAGQGVVMETFQMSQTRAYQTGGTVHIIVNNQIGFTTSFRHDARSTEYSTDVAKMIQTPILHVNSDDPEAVIHAIRLAVDYRMTFKKDVVVDLFCYRRQGHNEADEPSGTQPLMYKKINQQPTTRKIYGQYLIDKKIITQEENTKMSDIFRQSLKPGKSVVSRLVANHHANINNTNWLPYLDQKFTASHNTSFDLEKLHTLAQQICTIPKNFVLQRQVQKIITDRQKMATGKIPLNWGMAEMLAYATLISEQYSIRLTGQDVGRGTFSHRHAILHNQENGNTFLSLAKINQNNEINIEIYDSLLSEEAVLAFEYGYATTAPRTLVIWEAQFGDFANGAQVVIDQFITSGEIKWGRLCGLTMLLPHGYEGQGPEHSSARIERYLQLCAQHNIQVCLPTTPAQIFHMLRRQILRPLRKPLIVCSPKSLLRNKLAVSNMQELANGCFYTVINDNEINPQEVTRLILCSGKVYYDLYEARKQAELNHVAIIRIEQLYPFPIEELQKYLYQYTQVKEIIWCQEEPMNQGAWYCSQHNMHEALSAINSDKKLKYAGREASAAAACGYLSTHIKEQKKLVNEALGLC